MCQPLKSCPLNRLLDWEWTGKEREIRNRQVRMDRDTFKVRCAKLRKNKIIIFFFEVTAKRNSFKKIYKNMTNIMFAYL
jgi:hypothetical protein